MTLIVITMKADHSLLTIGVMAFRAASTAVRIRDHVTELRKICIFR